MPDTEWATGITYAQVINNVPCAYYEWDDLLFDCMNLRTDIERAGYGYSVVKQAMSGGTISGNTASASYAYGGGVYVGYGGSTFTMSGGAISGNSAYAFGGGVCVDYGGSTFTMSDGTISGNTASSSYAYGGGVYVNGGTFTKQSGGIIYGSDASGTFKNTAFSGDSYGHAVFAASDKKRNTTDGESVTLDSSVSGAKGGDGFRFFTLGDALFDSERRIKPNISFENLAAHIYFTETKTPMNRRERKKKSPFLGAHNGTAYALLYNGILGDKNVNGGNVLTHNTLTYIKREIEAAKKKQGVELEYNQMVIYGEATRLTHVSLSSNNIIFKQTPYDIKVW